MTISPLSWRNAKGESTLNLSVPAERSGPSDRSAADPGGQPGSRGAVPGRQSEVIPVDMATEFVTKDHARSEGYQPADAAKLADQQVKAPGGDGPDVPALPPLKITPSAAVCSTRERPGDAERTENAAARLCAAMFGLEAPSLPDSAPQEGQPQQDDAARSRNLSVQRTASARQSPSFYAKPAAGA
ncbi:YdgA family protein [Klebsiella pneumoniae subsp. pneumoniae]|nr:YdgA family protein [Klebsiella pneumoniae subsp. pneumoniae]